MAFTDEVPMVSVSINVGITPGRPGTSNSPPPRPEPSPPETGTGTKTETGAALIHRWAVLMHRWRRLSFRRRVWGSLGTHLNFIKQRGRISAELAG